MKQSDALAWIAQWRAAAVALEADRARELSHFDEKKNAKIAAAFFIVPGAAAERLQNRESSGLVEQQAIFLLAK